MLHTFSNKLFKKYIHTLLMHVYSIVLPVLCLGMFTVRDTSEKYTCHCRRCTGTAENCYVVSAILHNHTL